MMQLRSIDKLLRRLEDDGIDPEQYIAFFGLRKWASFGAVLKTEIVYVHSKLMCAAAASPQGWGAR
jgi:phospholipase D1/2